MKTRALVAVVVILLAGLSIALTKKDIPDTMDESDMLEISARDLDGYRMVRSVENPDYSYMMDEVTYRTLEPYGIVARVFENEQTGERYDVVLIASRSKDSFHDPRICFYAQGWALTKQWLDKIPTETRGELPVTIALMDGPGGTGKLAAFLYKGPGRFYGSTKELKLGMFLEQMKGGSNLDGAFYRFIPLHNNPDDQEMLDDLKRFIGAYMDESNRSSGGKF
ncbi:MAG: exosortase-associated EpsI family protein [Armatimonadetes bacterium]|nr:exosortase-associated EpsI family protein [Armatimonadota bacterium]